MVGESEPEVDIVATTSRVNWIENNAIPDSISMMITDINVVFPSVRSSEVVALTSRNTLKILNTINPVTRAFTIMDMTSPVTTNVSPHTAVTTWPCIIDRGETLPAIQIAREKQRN